MNLLRGQQQPKDEAIEYAEALRTLEAQIRDRVFYLYHEPRRTTPDLMQELAAIGKMAEDWSEAAAVRNAMIQLEAKNDNLTAQRECSTPSTGGNHG